MCPPLALFIYKVLKKSDSVILQSGSSAIG